MRVPLSSLWVDLTKLPCEDSDSSRHFEDEEEEEVVCSREWSPRKENSHPKKENADPWGKRPSQVERIPIREPSLISQDKFVPTASNAEQESQGKPSSGEKDSENKTFRIQTIGEVYALQKREGVNEGRFRNSGTLRKINEPLLMGTSYASYRSRNPARSKERNGSRSNDFVRGYQDPREGEAYATRFPNNGHEGPAQAESALMNPPNASAGPSVQLYLPDVGNARSSLQGGTLLRQWNQTTGEHSHIHETHPAHPGSEQRVPLAPPTDAAALHSRMHPSLYGGYGFSYEGPFYNPIAAPPRFPSLVVPPYPIGPIRSSGSPYPTPPNPTVDSANQQLQVPANGSTSLEANRELNGPQYFNSEEIPWVPGSTPFTSNLPISVIRKAHLLDLFLLQCLEYVSLGESRERKREKPESKSPKRGEAGEISTARYAGLLAHNMMEETNPHLARYFNPDRYRSQQTRRYVSMPDRMGSQKESQEIGSRGPSWRYPRRWDQFS
ncbi:hypothetical protein B9Z19DRAFT_1074040 [Tuber borchii]|uniref:Uncharacterized protein n=1 Tax=Tuber borchii TaxID=42251 RepID=A0A2T7A544_TUBBO|nr:hypothetical protein B9Z19DRAFT_1074040 [Tuber borchii]